jgi:hypothetical protein
MLKDISLDMVKRADRRAGGLADRFTLMTSDAPTVNN